MHMFEVESSTNCDVLVRFMLMIFCHTYFHFPSSKVLSSVATMLWRCLAHMNASNCLHLNTSKVQFIWFGQQQKKCILRPLLLTPPLCLLFICNLGVFHKRFLWNPEPLMWYCFITCINCGSFPVHFHPMPHLSLFVCLFPVGLTAAVPSMLASSWGTFGSWSRCHVQLLGVLVIF